MLVNIFKSKNNPNGAVTQKKKKKEKKRKKKKKSRDCSFFSRPFCTIESLTLKKINMNCSL
jgi:hypothetical protein